MQKVSLHGWRLLNQYYNIYSTTLSRPSFIIGIMQFVTALSVSKLEQAFDLVSVSDNQSLRKGEALLDTLSQTQDYPSLLLSYLSGDHDIDNKIKAALQLRTALSTRQYNVSPFETLFYSYLTCEEKIRKVLLASFRCANMDKSNIRQALVWGLENEDAGIRVLKLLKTTIVDYLVDKPLDVIQTLIEEICLFSENLLMKSQGLFTKCSDELRYRAVKTVNLLQQNYPVNFNPESLTKWIDRLKFVLTIPDSQSKFLVRCKMEAVRCLVILNRQIPQDQSTLKLIRQQTNRVWENYVPIRQYAAVSIRFLTELSHLRLYNWIFSPQSQTDVVKSIIVSVMGYLYNQPILYSRFEGNSGDIIDCYFQNQEFEDTRVQALKCIRSLVIHYFDSWLQIVRAGVENAPLSDQLLCFMCDSYSPNLPPLQSVAIQKLALNVFDRQIHQSFFDLYSAISTSSLKLSRKQTVRFLNQIRVVYCFMHRFEAQKIKTVSVFCSKIALSCPSLSSVCYNFIRKYFQSQENHLSSTLQPQGLLQQILKDMLLNRVNISLDHLQLVQHGLALVRNNSGCLQQLLPCLKDIILIMIKATQSDRRYQSIDLTFNVMDSYMELKFQPDFETTILSFMKEKSFTVSLARCYVKYLTIYKPDSKSAYLLLSDMFEPEFWVDNGDGNQLNTIVYVTLVKSLSRDARSYNQAISGLISNLQAIQRSTSSQPNPGTGVLEVIEGAFFQLVEIIREVGAVDEFYRMVLGVGQQSRVPLLTRMVEVCSPTTQEYMKEVLELCLDKSVGIQKSTFLGTLKVAFQILPKLVFTLNSCQSPVRWGYLVSRLVEYTFRKNDEAFRRRFCASFQSFMEEHPIDIASIFPEKFQLRLSKLILQQFD